MLSANRDAETEISVLLSDLWVMNKPGEELRVVALEDWPRSKTVCHFQKSVLVFFFKNLTRLICRSQNTMWIWKTVKCLPLEHYSSFTLTHPSSFWCLGVFIFLAALLSLPVHNVGIKAYLSIAPRNARRILFLPEFCVFYLPENVLYVLHAVCCCRKLPTGFYFYVMELTGQCNGDRIMIPSGFKLVCCKPYFALLPATGTKSPRKTKTSCRRCQTDAISICVHISIGVKNHKWTAAVSPFLLFCCVSVCTTIIKHNEHLECGFVGDLPDSPTNIVCPVSSITALATPMAFLILRRFATAPTSIVSLVNEKPTESMHYYWIENRNFPRPEIPHRAKVMHILWTSHACMLTYMSFGLLWYGKYTYLYILVHRI